MSFPRYPKYKPSGVEWLGDVPQHWDVWKLAHAFALIASGTTPKTDNREYYDDGDIPWVNTGDLNDGELEDCGKRITTRALADHSSLKLYPAGSLLIAMYGATIGKLAMLRFPATVNQACCVFTGASPIVSKFMFYWFLGLRQQILSLATGGGQPNVSQDILRTLRVGCPDQTEQTKIASFLDRETSKIDGLVGEQRRLIELLKEKRQAVISHAVTKGLNPNAPMKPSGIEWLGDVPEHWVVLSFRHLVTRVVVGIAEAATQAYAEEGVPMVRSTNINSGIVDESDMLFIAPEFAKKLEGKALRSGDIITTRTGANVGISAVVPSSLDLAQCFTLLISSPKPDVNPHFYAHYINALPGKCYVDLTAWGSSQPNISVPIIQEMPTIFPPLNEQVEIVLHIDRTSGQYGELIAEATRGIELLQERRTALISAAVTGKIDVRSFAPQTSEVA
jgi:type I restriction enzyme S subunit